MGTRQKKRKCKSCGKLFVPVYDTNTIKQVVCSHSCCVIHYDKQKPKSRKLARLVASMIGKRSMGEVRFAADNLDGKPINAEYEPDKFSYLVHKTCNYTPDFRVTIRKPTPKTKGKIFYIEFKGVLDLATRSKMKLVKEQHPTLDIRFVFQSASNKIRKGSKTTYGMWADQHGFKWADNTIPKEWLK